MDKATLQLLVENSSPDDWTVFTSTKSLLSDSGYIDRAVFNNDLMITIDLDWNRGVFYNDGDTNCPSWARVNRPWTNSYVGSARICYNGTTVFMKTLVSVDDHRGIIPYPNNWPGSGPYTADSLTYRSAEIFDAGLHGTYLKDSNITEV